VDREKAKLLVSEAHEISRMLRALIVALEKKSQQDQQ
jgi:hypothetical protein